MRRSTAASRLVLAGCLGWLGCQTGTTLFRETEADRLARKERPYVACLNTFRAACPMPDIGPCKRGVAIAARLRPSLPDLEAAGAAYIDALEALAPRCLEGRATAELTAGFDAADRALMAEVDRLEDRIQAETLAELTPGSLEYRRLRVLIEAKHFVLGAPDELAAAVDALDAGDPLAAPAQDLLRTRTRDAYNSLIDTSNRIAD